MLLSVGLYRERLQPALNRGCGDASRRSQRAGTPLGTAIGGFGLGGPMDGSAGQHDLGTLLKLGMPVA